MNWRFKFLGVAAGAVLIATAVLSAKPAADSATAPACCTTRQGSETHAVAGLRETLDRMQFQGEVREAYKVAQENPHLLAQLHCYCGCGRTLGHKNLLDCYRSHHAASCAICTGEALEAKKLFDQGASIQTIRQALRARYAGNNSN